MRDAHRVQAEVVIQHLYYHQSVILSCLGFYFDVRMWTLKPVEVKQLV